MREFPRMKNNFRQMKMHEMDAYYSKVCSMAGDGQVVTPENFNLSNKNFCFSRLHLVKVGKIEIVYSFEPETGEVCPELIQDSVCPGDDCDLPHCPECGRDSEGICSLCLIPR